MTHWLTDNLESRDASASKNFNIRSCERIIFGQLKMGARQTKNASLKGDTKNIPFSDIKVHCEFFLYLHVHNPNVKHGALR